MRVVDLFAVLCANPYCYHKIDSANSHIIYCGDCQTVLRDYSICFPMADNDEIFYLFSHQRINVSFAQRMIGHRFRFYDSCYRKKIKSEKVGRERLIDSELVIEIAKDLATAVSIPQAGRWLGIDKKRLYYLVKKGQIDKVEDVFGRPLIRLDSLERVKKIDESLRATQMQRKRESLKANPTDKEYSVRRIADIFDVTDILIARYFRHKILKGYKRKNRWYARKQQLAAFCRKILSNKHSKLVMREGAHRYLDSIAAG